MEDYVNHLASLSRSEIKPDMLILREKDLEEPEYEKLLAKVKKGCDDTGIELAAHTCLAAAEHQGVKRIHLPFLLLEPYTARGKLDGMEKIGVSIHSVEEAATAWEMGASYLTAGHIFTTDCKKGLAPRGIGFLETICKAVDIPVYAIGGIHPKNLELIKKTGAAGACMMSEFLFL